MQIIFDDKDLEELITTGRNSKYKKYTRNKKFMRHSPLHITIYAYLNVQATSVLSSSTMNNLQEPMA